MVAEPPVPKATFEIHQLHAEADRFGVLTDGALLISPRGGGPVRLDVNTGGQTPWTVAWTPDPRWKLAPDGAPAGSAPEVSPDGRWVAVPYSWEPATPPVPRAILTTAYVVARHDGSDPRCVGLTFTQDEEEPPPVVWIHGTNNLVGAWTAECTPDAAGRPRSFPTGPKFNKRTPELRAYDPATAAHTLYPAVADFSERDPLGDHALVRYHEAKQSGVRILDLKTAAVLQTIPDPTADDLQWSGGWVAPDAVLLNTHHSGKLKSQRILWTDGRSVAIPTPTWRHHARLPNGEHLFTRDAGATLEQGKVDWTTLQVESPRPRPDLLKHAGRFDQNGQTTFTPGLGGIIVHVPLRGTLLLAPLDG